MNAEVEALSAQQRLMELGNLGHDLVEALEQIVHGFGTSDLGVEMEKAKTLINRAKDSLPPDGRQGHTSGQALERVLDVYPIRHALTLGTRQRVLRLIGQAKQSRLVAQTTKSVWTRSVPKQTCLDGFSIFATKRGWIRTLCANSLKQSKFTGDVLGIKNKFQLCGKSAVQAELSLEKCPP